MAYLTPIDHVEKICEYMQIDFDKVTNVYNFGSHVYGNTRSDSDYDIVIVGNFVKEPIVYKNEKDPYFYRFEMNEIEIDGRIYDTIIHSTENFRKILQNNFIVFVEALFTDEKYKTINKIDYRELYLNTWFTKEKIKNSLKNEIHYAIMNVKRFNRGTLYDGLDGKWVIKKYFNVMRYHHIICKFLLTGEFIDFGSIWNDHKNQILERYDVEGDDCVNEICKDMYGKIKVYLVQI